MTIQNPPTKGTIALLVAFVPVLVALTNLVPEILPRDSAPVVDPGAEPVRWVVAGTLTGTDTNVELTLRPAMEEVFEARVASNGTFIFDQIPAGVYLMWIEDPVSGQPVSYQVQVGGAAPASASFDNLTGGIARVTYTIAAP